MGRNQLKQIVSNWNLRFPLDRWYRNRHNIALNSTEHRQTRLIDILLEYEEQVLFDELLRQKSDQEKYNPGRGDWLKKRDVYLEVSEEETEELYDNFDFKNIERDEEGNIIV